MRFLQDCYRQREHSFLVVDTLLLTDSPHSSEAAAGPVEVLTSPESSSSFSEGVCVQFHDKSLQLLQESLVTKDRAIRTDTGCSSSLWNSGQLVGFSS